MLKLFKILNLTNLDVALGAMIFTGYFCNLFDVTIDLTPILTLGVSVWVIYTFDHLVDSKKIGAKHNSSIHLFHKTHYKTFIIFLIAALMSLALLLPFLHANTLIGGAILSIVVFIYFITINLLPVKSIYHKELMIALVYFAGVLLIPLTDEKFVFSTSILPILFAYFLIVLNNIITFSIFDKRRDAMAGFPSITQQISGLFVRNLICGLNILLFITVCLSFNQWDWSSLLFCISMSLILLIIYSFQENKFVQENYRVIGDGIFYIPLLYSLI